MRFQRFALSFFLLLASSVAICQSDAQKSFDKLKTLAGTWEGRVTTEPKELPFNGNTIYASMRVTSRGNTLVHEMKKPGTPDDITKDDPITMLYLDGDRLMLTHYCDAGNRPRMVAKTSADGKTIDFDFLDVAGSTENGHMHHATFNMIDANHHIEDWSFMEGNQMIHAHMELARAN